MASIQKLFERPELNKKHLAVLHRVRFLRSATPFYSGGWEMVSVILDSVVG